MALVDQIIGVESGGNPNAKNPLSSASGPSQFIDSTWLSMLAKHRPDLAEGRSPQELLALKSDPQLSRQMTEAYAADNGLVLQNAGFEASPANTYLAHFAGPQGAVKVLSADPSTPVEAVLGQGAVNANPFLKGMTAADLQGWAARKMGGAPQQTAQASPASPSASVSASLPPSSTPSLPASSPAPVEAAASLFGQMPAGRSSGIDAPPIFYARRKPPDISQLRAALEALGNRGFFFGG
jgi:hypothetical protein